MSVTDDLNGTVPPHGLKRYRPPYKCRCDVCRAANTEYCTERKRVRREANPDELAVRRKKRATTRRTESGDSVRKPKVIGEMERAVIEEVAEIADPKPTLVVAAKKLARIVDNPELSNMHNTCTKQLMALMAEMRGDTDKAKATGKRKSGSRLATVGSLTKVRRAQ